jgi:hypothetical protein
MRADLLMLVAQLSPTGRSSWRNLIVDPCSFGTIQRFDRSRLARFLDL